jgi:hypothetical protein
MSLRIGVDIDGVLADFRTAFHQAAFRSIRHDVKDIQDPKTSELLDDRDVRRVWDYISRTTNWWMELQAYEPDQIARFYDLTRAARWEVFFVTNRPPSAGDAVQFQTAWWLERHGFYLPAVVTVPGSRGELANALRLDLLIDDLLRNCIDVVSGSASKAILMLRDEVDGPRQQATSRGIGVVSAMADVLPVLERLNDELPKRRGRLMRLADWFKPAAGQGDTLPHNPRELRPLPQERPASPPPTPGPEKQD